MRLHTIVCDACGFQSGNSKDFQELLGEKHLCDKCWDAYMDRKRQEEDAIALVWKGFWRDAPPVEDKPKKRKT